MRSRTFLAFTFAFISWQQGISVQAQESGSGKEQAPEQFLVKFDATVGEIVLEVNRKWSPNGADHFYRAVKSGFFDECRFFRVVPDFIVQFGINGDPKVQEKWRENPIKDDRVAVSNERGTLTYAKPPRGKNTRTTQIFINLKDNDFLDEQGFSPFAQVVKGMEFVDKITAEYGERPDQGMIQQHGNEYLKRQFPRLDFIKKATVVKPDERK